MKYCFIRKLYLGGIFLVVIAASTLAAFFVFGQPVYADTVDWLSPGITGEIIENPYENSPHNLNRSQTCRNQKVMVGNSLIYEDACILHAKSFRLGTVQRCTPNWWGGVNCQTFSIISIGRDEKFYKLTIGYFSPGYYDWQASPSSDTIISNGYDRKLLIIDNIIEHLASAVTPLGKEYSLPNIDQFYLHNSAGQTVGVNRSILTENAEWLVAESGDIGLFRIHLPDKKIKMFTMQVPSYRYGADPLYDFSVTEDGKNIIAAGSNVNAKIYRLDDGCGKESDVFWGSRYELGDSEYFPECPSRSLSELVHEISELGYAGYGIRTIDSPEILEDGYRVTLKATTYLPVDGKNERWVELKAPGYVERPTLDYLALGDSYSSGEGDIDRKSDGTSYYLPGTANSGQCHISTRSYPFLLRDYYHFSPSKMASVACSGAQVMRDYISNGNYLGQHRELEKNSEEDRIAKRGNALDNFTPGIVSQIEFVKKYKPEIITLTGGGNDIGFAEILAYCATPSTILGAPVIIFTCEYAKENSVLSKMLSDAIDTQFTYTKLLVDRLKLASPSTQIIVIGYPSFVSEDRLCQRNVFSLGKVERVKINEAVTKMNNMLEAVAKDANISFVDVENVLIGGRLCENSEFMTGVADVGYIKAGIFGGAQETFHPNAKGHEKIAQKVAESEALLGPGVSPSSNNYSPSASYITTLSLPSEINLIGHTLSITVGQMGFASNSEVLVTAHSDPVHLGSYLASSDGSLELDLNTSILPAGKHVIVLEGSSFSGESVKYYKFLTIIEPEIQNVSQMLIDQNRTSAIASSSTAGNNDTDRYEHVQSRNFSETGPSAPLVDSFSWVKEYNSGIDDYRERKLEDATANQIYTLLGFITTTLLCIFFIGRKHTKKRFYNGE